MEGYGSCLWANRVMHGTGKTSDEFEAVERKAQQLAGSRLMLGLVCDGVAADKQNNCSTDAWYTPTLLWNSLW
jgi:hypothetical protein